MFVRGIAAVLRAAIFALGLGAAPAAQAQITWNVSNTTDSSMGSLRHMITNANLNCGSGPQTIAFAIAGPGPHVITLSSPLPPIACSGATIDGYTQSGASRNTLTNGANDAVIAIRVDGSALDCVPAIQNTAPITIRGIAFTNFGPGCDAIHLANTPPAGSVIEGSYINVMPDGTATPGGGVLLSGGQGHVIGGAVAGSQNLWAGPLYMTGVLGATVRNNQFTGVATAIESTGGRDSSILDNRFTSLTGPAIQMPGALGYTIAGNWFSSVMTAVDLAGEGGNSFYSNTVVQAYSMGVRVSGTLNTVFDNDISGSLGPGIYVISSSNEIFGNRVWGNEGGGIRIDAGTGNSLSSNEAFGNAGLPGIDLAPPGPTPNDAFDADGGPNGLQNHPVVTGAYPFGTGTVVFGTLSTGAYGSALIEVFSNATMPSTTQGEAYRGWTTVALDGSGFGTWSVSIPGSADFISATATVDPCAPSVGCPQTSEYSPAVAATLAPTATVSFAPEAATAGESATLRVVLANPEGGMTYTGVAYDLPAIAGLDVTNAAALGDCAFAPVAMAKGLSGTSVSGVTLGPGTTCTVDFTVSSSLAGTYFLPAEGLVAQSAEGAKWSNVSAAALVIVVLDPQASVGFTPETTSAGEPSTLRVTVTNPNPALTLHGVGYDVPVPAGLTVSGAAALGDCVFLQPASSKGISGTTVGDVTLVPGGSCTVDFTVSAPVPGAYVIPPASLVVTSAEGPTGTNSAPAVLTVILLGPAATVSFSPVAIAPGAGSTLRVAVANPNASSTLSGVGYVLALPPGLESAGAAALGDCDFGPAAAKGIAGTSVSGVTLAPNGTCTVDFAVSAPIPGTYTLAAESLVVSSAEGWTGTNAFGATLLVALEPMADVAFSPDSIVPGASALLQVIVANLDPQRSLSGVGYALPLPAGLTLDAAVAGGDCTFAPRAVKGIAGTVVSGVELAPGATCTVDFTVSAPAAGTYSIPAGSILVTSAEGVTWSNASTATLGVVEDLPAMSLSSTLVVFPAQAVRTTSSFPQVVTLLNAGTAALEVTAVSIAGDFAYVGCAYPSVMAPGQGCALNIAFAPLVPGVRTGAIVITDNAPGSPHVITLTGTGTWQEVGVLGLSARVLDFGQHVVGVTSPPLSLRVFNSGGATLALHSIEVDEGSFRHSSACGGSLAPGASCHVDVWFTPEFVGEHARTLRISDGVGTLSVRLVGIGVAAAVPRLAVVSSIDFGPVVVGASARRTLSLSNAGEGVLVVQTVGATGTAFGISGSCAALAPAEACVLEAVFSPGAVGAHAGRIDIASNDSRGTVSVGLSGQGVPQPVPRLVVSPGSIGFGNQLIGVPGAARAFEIVNDGEAPLVLAGIEASAGFRVRTACPETIEPQARCGGTVEFKPYRTGPQAGALAIASNDARSPHRMSLTGTGCRPYAAIGRVPRLLCGP